MPYFGFRLSYEWSEEEMCKDFFYSCQRSNMTQGLPPKKNSFRFYAFFGIGCSLPSHLELKVLAFLTNRSFIVYPQQSNRLFKRSKNK